MILNPEKLNITEEERQALLEIFKQCVLDYLAANEQLLINNKKP